MYYSSSVDKSILSALMWKRKALMFCIFFFFTFKIWAHSMSVKMIFLCFFPRFYWWKSLWTVTVRAAAPAATILLTVNCFHLVSKEHTSHDKPAVHHIWEAGTSKCLVFYLKNDQSNFSFIKIANFLLID